MVQRNCLTSWTQGHNTAAHESRGGTAGYRAGGASESGNTSKQSSQVTVAISKRVVATYTHTSSSRALIKNQAH